MNLTLSIVAPLLLKMSMVVVKKLASAPSVTVCVRMTPLPALNCVATELEPSALCVCTLDIGVKLVLPIIGAPCSTIWLAPRS